MGLSIHHNIFWRCIILFIGRVIKKQKQQQKYAYFIYVELFSFENFVKDFLQDYSQIWVATYESVVKLLESELEVSPWEYDRTTPNNQTRDAAHERNTFMRKILRLTHLFFPFLLALHLGGWLFNRACRVLKMKELEETRSIWEVVVNICVHSGSFYLATLSALKRCSVHDRIIKVEQMVEWELAGETEVLG
jgi:hypothetical protein